MLEQQVSCLSGHVEFVRVTLYGGMDVSTKGVCLGDPLANFFLHPLTWMATKKKVLELHFFMPKTTKEDHEKIFKNPAQYKQQHSKRYKQSATCHIFYLQNPLKMIPKKGLGIIRVIYQIEKAKGRMGGWQKRYHQNNLG